VLRSGRALQRQRSPRRPLTKTSVLALQRAFKVERPLPPPAEEQVQFSDKIDPQLLRPSVLEPLPVTKPILKSNRTATARESKLTFWTVALVFSSLFSLWLWSFWLAISSPQYNLTMDESGSLSISQTAPASVPIPEYSWPETPGSLTWPR